MRMKDLLLEISFPVLSFSLGYVIALYKGDPPLAGGFIALATYMVIWIILSKYHSDTWWLTVWEMKEEEKEYDRLKYGEVYDDE